MQMISVAVMMSLLEIHAGKGCTWGRSRVQVSFTWATFSGLNVYRFVSTAEAAADSITFHCSVEIFGSKTGAPSSTVWSIRSWHLDGKVETFFRSSVWVFAIV
jgi:hypothetical protein